MVALLSFAIAQLAAMPPEPVPTASDLSAYESAAARVGRSPGAHVRLALWCEAHGLEAEHLKHLVLAVVNDPSNASARGLLGLIRYRGRWLHPNDVPDPGRTDPALAEKLAEYNARRAKMADTAAGHWDLGIWCEENGLKAEAEAHFTAVTRLSPGRPEAWKKLGCQRYKGRWLTAEQAALARADDAAQAEADRYWKPRLAQCKFAIRDASKQAETESELSSVTDPRAIPAIWEIFAHDGRTGQHDAVRLLAQIDGPTASQALAYLAVFSRYHQVRSEAARELVDRDPREFVDFLISRMHEPLEYRVRDDASGVGVLLIEGESTRLRRIYDPPTPLIFFNEKFLQDMAGGNPFKIAGDLRKLDSELRISINKSVQNAVRQRQEDIAAIGRRNQLVDACNRTIEDLLQSVTGESGLGPDREAWNEWWSEQMGRPYESPKSPSPVKKRLVTRFASIAVPTALVRGSTSCFGAGTLVHARDGLRAIETFRVGDRVLCQDTTTGALHFQPVVRVIHNTPKPTWRINVAGESFVSTGIHRFWKAGHGWVMARDLKAGDLLRLRDGLARVSSVTADEVLPVFNLEVETYPTYFVGRAGALVHDNTLPLPASEPFDAVPASAELAIRGR